MCCFAKVFKEFVIDLLEQLLPNTVCFVYQKLPDLNGYYMKVEHMVNLQNIALLAQAIT